MMKINVHLKLYVQRRIFTYQIYQSKLPPPNIYPFGTIHKVEIDFLGCKSGRLQLERSVCLFQLPCALLKQVIRKNVYFIFISG